MGFPCRFKSDFPHQRRFYRHFRAICSLGCTLDKILNRNIWENKVLENINKSSQQTNGSFRKKWTILFFLRFFDIAKTTFFFAKKRPPMRRSLPLSSYCPSRIPSATDRGIWNRRCIQPSGVQPSSEPWRAL